jgi:hypothetical protein
MSRSLACVIQHALPRKQQWVPRGCEQARRLLDGIGIGRHAENRHRLVIELAVVLRFPDLRRHFDQHRASLAAGHGVVGAPHQIGKLLHGMRQRRPFGDRPIDVGGTKHRTHILPGQRQAARDHQQRHVFRVRLGDPWKRVFDAGAGLGGKHAVLSAAGDSGIAIGHSDADTLLPA